ncbi:hypothetical protein KZO01_26440 [Kurthia zopfii]|uniref:Uncharacterized protein conserved in bacteria (DUF2087) n=2 Tax=Kurthia zopfii TaxID=1650 RepID=A0A2U3AAD7_9BACL|nr:DUF2087 domain-containing protein [Kurthia zopfii]PWI21497.1 hypothetical protein DF281_11945 [Kurthia zopfii]TDR34728.1 hypothetical protein DFR61_13612 [Kurthia zopfii]STX10384.1 Uncharacterized protein conserved in bacteria (DUF2087) [Kurthia zopfii]VEI08568.1 Uncharacterized protein conserved in bacteria (DUF2087) [Kurthia zopfii]GEK32335.1 hypothetical protein KZO01_26440 [Kurthia zopfii]
MMNEKEQRVITQVFLNGIAQGMSYYPRKQAQKRVVLQVIASNFSRNQKYTEKQINEVIKQFWPDFVTIRRDLFEFQFMNRTDDGSEYWLIEQEEK